MSDAERCLVSGIETQHYLTGLDHRPTAAHIQLPQDNKVTLSVSKRVAQNLCLVLRSSVDVMRAHPFGVKLIAYFGCVWLGHGNV